MRIAFYAPLKPPDHPVLSGDRTVARSLMTALRLAGHDVVVASRFRTYDPGDIARQTRLRDLGGSMATRLLRRYAAGRAPPEVWFTYHLYHKAPDWLGPPIARRLGIPYVLAEASYAPKQAGGRWALGHDAAGEAIHRADLIVQLNPADADCVRPLAGPAAIQVSLPPFIDTALFRTPDRELSRGQMAADIRLDTGVPWLLAVAMFRADQKLLSYRVLAAALARLAAQPWQLVIAGSGLAEADVRALFAPFKDRIRWVGIVPPDSLRVLYRACDLFVWPAVKEAWGMAIVEAQAAGVPVVAGRSGGVASVLSDGTTGLLTPEGDAAAFSAAVGELLADPARRQAMGAAAAQRAERIHDIAAASAVLDRHIRGLCPEPR